MVYVIVVESDDGTSSTNQSVMSDKGKAEAYRKELQSALGEDNVVVVEEHEIQ